MSITKHFISESIRNLEIDEYLEKSLDRAGYGGVEITRTPLGTRVVVYAMKPGIVIGRRGTNIHDLSKILEEKFKLSNPQIAVSEIEVPELNPKIMASRMSESLSKGTHFRRVGFWASNQIMRAGALGVEIIIRGKLTTQRHRFEKYIAGYLPKAGDPASRNARRAVTHVKLKPGVLGITIRIIPPDATFPDQIKTKSEVIIENKDEKIEVAPEIKAEEEKDAEET
jgi:small subunit ribosomal protein S3